MRGWLGILGLLALAGCAAPGPDRDLKEVYVEAQQVVGVANLLPYPFAPETESRAYSALRSFQSGRLEGRLKLGRLLGQWPKPPKPDPEPDPEADPEQEQARPQPEGGEEDHGDVARSDPAAADSDEHDPANVEEGIEPAADDDLDLDLTAFPKSDPPSLLVFPEEVTVRTAGACYLGHTSYVRQVFAPGAEVVHHLRLLVVNRQPVPIRVPLERVTVAVASVGEGEAESGVLGSSFQQAGASNSKGERIDVFVVPPQEQRLAHVFFFGGRLPPALHVSWEVELIRTRPEQEESPSWAFAVTLLRRYVIPEGVISSLEASVARGDVLPEASPDSSWTEPHLQSVPEVAPATPAEPSGPSGF